MFSEDQQQLIEYIKSIDIEKYNRIAQTVYRLCKEDRDTCAKLLAIAKSIESICMYALGFENIE